ncbi:MAG: CvpA family protein [Burkholderiaceae bacterium]
MDWLTGLTGWDVMVLVVAIVSAGLGIMQGMVRSVADLGSWIIALFGSFMIAPAITEFIDLKPYPWVGLILGFIVLFFLTRLIGVVFAKLLRSAGLGGADRSLGAVVGLARAVLVIALLASAGRLLDMHKQPGWQNALSRPALEAAADLVAQYAPKLEQFKPAALR